jgi:hypothetical protein
MLPPPAKSGNEKFSGEGARESRSVQGLLIGCGSVHRRRKSLIGARDAQRRSMRVTAF